jgi:hypothetical protein
MESLCTLHLQLIFMKIKYYKLLACCSKIYTYSNPQFMIVLWSVIVTISWEEHTVSYFSVTSTMKTKEVCSSEILIFYHIAWCNNPEGYNMNLLFEELTSHIILWRHGHVSLWQLMCSVEAVSLINHCDFYTFHRIIFREAWLKLFRRFVLLGSLLYLEFGRRSMRRCKKWVGSQV